MLFGNSIHQACSYLTLLEVSVWNKNELKLAVLVFPLAVAVECLFYYKCLLITFNLSIFNRKRFSLHSVWGQFSPVGFCVLSISSRYCICFKLLNSVNYCVFKRLLWRLFKRIEIDYALIIMSIKSTWYWVWKKTLYCPYCRFHKTEIEIERQ